jgi:hypothetical protein
MKKKPQDTTVEEVKRRSVEGLLVTRYAVLVSIPKPMVINPTSGIGISVISVNNKELKEPILDAFSVVVSKVLKTRVTLEFTVAESRLRQFLSNLCKVDGAEIIIGEDK